MLYKSVRSSSKKCWVSFAAFAAVAACVGSSSAWAALTVQPTRADGTILSNVTNGIAYYPSSNLAAGAGVDTSDSVVPFPVSLTQDYSTESSGQNAVFFNISSDQTSFTANVGGTSVTYQNANTRLLIMAFINSGGNLRPIPISYYNSNALGGGTTYTCSGNSYCDLQDSGNPNYFFGAPYTPQTTIRIGIYPKDICTYYSGGVGTPICTDSSHLVVPGSANPPNVLQLPQITFYVAAVTPGVPAVIQFSPTTFSASNTNPGTNVGVSAEQLPLTLSFQNQGSNANCTAVNAEVYFPGDQQIQLDTTQFSITAPTGASGFAPAGGIAIASTTSTSPDASAGPWTSSTFANYVSLPRLEVLGAKDQVVTGFTNSTSSAPVYYKLGVFVRDRAGFVANSACQVNNVQTADIRGFLQESKCFIATAAYQSGRAAPVMMLRQFRDEILLHFGLGQAFVHWYYRWSPSAADWLIDHPAFRYPVLIALTPVEAVAWLSLHPAFLTVLFGLMMMSGAIWMVMRARVRDTDTGESL
jgi:hypothetical protein